MGDKKVGQPEVALQIAEKVDDLCPDRDIECADGLIKHEQGHYDITALLARDFYWRLRGLVGMPFSSIAEMTNAVNAHASATVGGSAQINLDYDNDTQHSRNGSEQWNWWSAIQRAQQLHRTPLEKNADGSLSRIELMAALRAAGLTG